MGSYGSWSRPPEGERCLHSAIKATALPARASRKSRVGGAASSSAGNAAARPSTLKRANSRRRASTMRSRIGAALVAISGNPPSRLSAGCGLLQDSFHPLDALFDLLDRVGVRQPQVPLPRLAKGRAGEDGHAAIVQHPVGQLALALPGLDDVGKHVKGAQRLVAMNAG